MHWPPDDAPDSNDAGDGNGNEPKVPPSGSAPMFPLPGVYLFPRQLLPLNIFEPRYRQMIEDSLDGPGRIVLAPIPTAAKDDDEPRAIRPVAGLAEIIKHERLDDGRFGIWLLGIERVAISETPSEHLYRTAEWKVLTDQPPRPDEEASLRHALREAATEKTKGAIPLPDETDAGTLADVLVQTLTVDDDERAKLYAETDVTRRAARALELYEAGR